MPPWEIFRQDRRGASATAGEARGTSLRAGSVGSRAGAGRRRACTAAMPGLPVCRMLTEVRSVPIQTSRQLPSGNAAAAGRRQPVATAPDASVGPDHALPLRVRAATAQLRRFCWVAAVNSLTPPARLTTSAGSSSPPSDQSDQTRVGWAVGSYSLPPVRQRTA